MKRLATVIENIHLKEIIALGLMDWSLFQLELGKFSILPTNFTKRLLQKKKSSSI